MPARFDMAAFTDLEGAPFWLSGEVGAIFTRHPEKETVIATFPGRELVSVADKKSVRVIVMQSGHWEVTETYGEILAQLNTKKEEPND